MLENISVDISVAELEKLVKEVVEKQFNKTATKVVFTTETRSVGYGISEHDEVVFTGATVKLVPRRIDV
jgi:superfamily II RNA helicase